MPKSPQMKTENTLTIKHSPTTAKSAAILMLLTILDTTWRAFVPTIGGTLAGVGLDNITGKAPIFTAVFIIVGFVASALLIARQLHQVRNSR